MRNIAKIIEQVLEIVPAQAGQYKLRARLTKLLEDCLYTPPEMMWARWQDGSNILNDELPKVSELVAGSWQAKIACLWANDPNFVSANVE